MLKFTLWSCALELHKRYEVINGLKKLAASVFSYVAFTETLITA